MISAIQLQPVAKNLPISTIIRPIPPAYDACSRNEMKGIDMNRKNEHPKQLGPDLAVARILAVDRSTVWDWAKKNPGFPKPFKLSAGCTRWDLAEVEAWKQSRRVA